MKKILAFLLVLTMALSVLCACSGGKTSTSDASPESTPGATAPSASGAVTESETKTESEAPGTSTPSNSPSEEQPSSPSPELPDVSGSPLSPDGTVVSGEIGYGVYYLTTKSGSKLAFQNNNQKINSENEVDARLTIHKKTVDDETYYGIYMGDDESRSLTCNKDGKVYAGFDKYKLTDPSLWEATFEDGFARFKNKKEGTYLTIEGKKAVLKELDAENEEQLFKIEKAAKSTRFDEYVSKKGNIVVRFDYKLTQVTQNRLTESFLQTFVDHFQEAYEAEIALTGYIPYDVIVIDGWKDQQIVAGVVDNYNVIVVDNAFMATEMKLMPLRLKFLNVYDMSFALLHEMGHMFDSQRAWNFESEAWTDLKLCYVIYKMTEDHKKTDGRVYGCAPADYRGSKECFTYEKMADCLNIHAHKGAMVTVYGFYGAAREFLLMAYDFGWEPFIKTFHWFQDNGYTQPDFERMEKFEKFVEKLSEYSGKDIKKEYLTVSWPIFEDFYTGKTNTAV